MFGRRQWTLLYMFTKFSKVFHQRKDTAFATNCAVLLFQFRQTSRKAVVGIQRKIFRIS